MSPTEVRVYLTPPPGQGMPFDVVSSLCAAIGKLYPSAMMGPGHPDGMSLIIPPGDRPAAPFTENDAETTRIPPDPALGDDCGITSWDGQTLTTTTPADYRQQLAAWAYTMLTAGAGAFNYVEQQVHTPDGRPFIVTAAWSQQQTPHQLRIEAERRADAAEQELAALQDATRRSESPA